MVDTDALRQDIGLMTEECLSDYARKLCDEVDALLPIAEKAIALYHEHLKLMPYGGEYDKPGDVEQALYGAVEKFLALQDNSNG